MLLINNKARLFLVSFFLLIVALISRADDQAFKDESSRYYSNVPEVFLSITKSLQDALYSVSDYYYRQPYYLKSLPLLTVVIREYSLHRLHLNIHSMKSAAMELIIAKSFVILLLYDLYNGWNDGKYTGNLKWHNSDGLLFFEVNPDLLSEQHAYHSLSKQSGITLLQLAIINVDDQYHAIVKYQKHRTIHHSTVNLVFNESLSGIQFLEPDCLSGTEDVKGNTLLLSIFSEEVIRQIFSNMTTSINEPGHEPSFITGKHYSAGTEMAARRLEVNDVNGDNTFAICLKHSRFVDVLTKKFNNSNDSLIEEAMVRSAKTETGWIAYVSMVLFRQAEHYLSQQALAITSQYVFTGECPICLNHLSIWIEVAKCGRHWFCANCWALHTKQINSACPMCRN
ncbi:RING finger protein [Endozoicomonas lisbonensis]|uniref:RING-type domain-containing protein n=1 Tax=Endozoicomonas lisbonensis TaxID=3120522 RepID=A0ABV2SKL8_9GAMM